MFQNKKKLLLLLGVVLLVGGAGLILGKFNSGETISGMYDRHDFTLLDDSGALFHLKEFPKDKKLLLIFTPDGVPTADVVPFFAFTKNLPRLEKEGVEAMLITRTNREIVRNFKLAAKFQGRILLDPSGTVGKLVQVWPDPSPVDYWAYALVDSDFKGYWLTTTKQLLGVDEVLRHLPSSSKKTSSASP